MSSSPYTDSTSASAISAARRFASSRPNVTTAQHAPISGSAAASARCNARGNASSELAALSSTGLPHSSGKSNGRAAALKIAATTCVIGAVVGEWVGSNEGLGAVILQAMYDYRAPTLYATVVLAATMAVIFFSFFSFLERRVIRWRQADIH